METRAFTTAAGATLRFTALGFGGTALGNMRARQSEDAAAAIVEAAWASGQRYFDTAPLYGLGLSERRLGTSLSGKPRDAYTLSTKVGRRLVAAARGEENGGMYLAHDGVKFVFDYSYDGVMRSFEDSLARLGVDRIDILYVHDIDGPNHGGRAGSEARIAELMERGGWQALDKLRASGAVRAIGCGVNEWEPCARLMEVADPDLFLLAGRYTLLEQEPLNALFPRCTQRGVRIVIGGPFNSGALAGAPFYDYAPITKPIAARVAALQEICAVHGVKLADAALQFPLAHPAVLCVIAGAASAADVSANAASLAAPIPAAFWQALKDERAIHREAPTPC